MKKLKYIAATFLTLLLLAAVIPFAMPLTDTGSFKGNYRIPYSMGEDYFLYNIYSKHAAGVKTIPVIGDSVIWGHYTGRDNTLPAYLNKLNASTRFMNMGLDGIHPAAMNGLVKNYTSGLRNRKIIVGINLLWMSSPRHDLTGPVNSEINHRGLLPQFSGNIPSYKPALEDKISAVISRTFPVFSWIDHVRLTRFAGRSFYLWTMDNPRKCLTEYFSHINNGYVPPEGIEPDKMREQKIDWVTPDRSLQWKFMLETLETLKKNGNDVAAVITPFNTYMMTEESRTEYYRILSRMESALRSIHIIPVVPLSPVKKYFADSSHPTAEGYRLIAEDIMKNSEFTEFIRK